MVAQHVKEPLQPSHVSDLDAIACDASQRDRLGQTADVAEDSGMGYGRVRLIIQQQLIPLRGLVISLGGRFQVSNMRIATLHLS